MPSPTRRPIVRAIAQLSIACLLLARAAFACAAPPVKLTVLSYHEIAEKADALVPAYAVPPASFAAQMQWLRETGHHFVGLDAVLADAAGRRPLPPDAVLVTFDDGYRSMYANAFPVLKAMRIPSVVALVGSWLEPKDGSVDFDGKAIPRSELLSWDDIRTMQASGLVEIGSHTYDLHRGIPGNPQGNLEPAATTREWLAAQQRYEDEAAYQRRVAADLRRNSALLRARLGRAPRVIVWPYGRYNIETVRIARSLGMRVGLSLDDGPNTAATPLSALRRVLVMGTMTLPDLAREIDLRNSGVFDDGRPVKAMHLDLDYIYDPDPAQQERNLGRWLDRIAAMGVNTVYLQAFSDPDANGAADAVYFPNRHLPMRADLFNRVAWQIATRTPVKRVYAWMPLLAWQLPAGDPAARDTVVTLPSVAHHLAMGYPRLSPFSPLARKAIRELYEDLGRCCTIDGILFHDDVTLSDYEDGSAWALKAYRDWGLPGSVAAIRADDRAMARWTRRKTAWLDAFAGEVAQATRDQQPGLATARNLYAQVMLNPRAEAWYAQSYESSLAHYDYTAVMAMPYMEQAPDANAFYRQLVDRMQAIPGATAKTVLELQTVDWRHDDAALPSAELAGAVRALYGWGVRNIAYYPDNLYRNDPDPAVLKPVLDSQPNWPPSRASSGH